MPLNPTDGAIVAGVPIDQHRFLGRMKAAQLFQVAIDPRRTEDLRQLEGNTELANVRRIRLEIQRLFEGAKAKNVESYARYVASVAKGESGMAPPIILYSEPGLPFEGEASQLGHGTILIPWGVQLVAIDGETQLAARFEAANIDAKTKDDFVPVVICHGLSLAWARQVFHDLNLLAVRPNAAVGIAMDERDPLTQVAREVETEVPFFKGRVNKVRRQLRGSDHEVVTITALRGACITLAEGISGVKYGARPVTINMARVPRIREVAIAWFNAVGRTLGPAVQDRTRSIAGTPPVLAAIGALAHELLEIDDATQREVRQDELLVLLREINWSKGKQWEGIAGKFTPKGSFSVGGTKETAYSVYSAIADRSSPGFKAVRQHPVVTVTDAAPELIAN